jgi:hypothetical protein
VRWDCEGSVHRPVPQVRVGTNGLSANPTIGTELPNVHVAGANDNSSNTRGQGRGARERSARAAKSQSRRDKWLAAAHSADLKTKYRNFLKGYDIFRKSCTVQHSDIEKAMQNRFSEDGDNFRDATMPAGQVRLNQAREVEVREMQRTIEMLQDGGVGFITENKKDGWVRLMFENFNSLGVFTQTWKIDRLKYLIKHLHIDIISGCELQCDWSFVDSGSHFPDLLANGQVLKGLASHNINERIQREQMGGTAIASIGRVTDVTTAMG